MYLESTNVLYFYISDNPIQVVYNISLNTRLSSIESKSRIHLHMQQLQKDKILTTRTLFMRAFCVLQDCLSFD